MLADAEAMSIDAFTYLFNMGAEYIKSRPLNGFSILSVKVPIFKATSLETVRSNMA